MRGQPQPHDQTAPEASDMGVDIGFDYDNTSTPLRLTWSEAGFPGTFYKSYGAVSCQ